MSKIKNGGLDQYDAESFEPQQLQQLALKGFNDCDQYLQFGMHCPN